MGNLEQRASVFAALGEPVRLAIVDHLAVGDVAPGELAKLLGLGTNLLAHHLKVLEETGVLRREVIGRSHRLSLEPDVLSVAADWMDRQRALWGRLFDVVDEYLKEEAPQ